MTKGWMAHQKAHKFLLSCSYTGNFSPAIAMQYSEIIALPLRGKKLQPGCTVCRQNLPTETLLEYSDFLVFCNFSGVVALPAQDMLSTEICTCHGSEIISWNCIAIARKKCKCSRGFRYNLNVTKKFNISAVFDFKTESQGLGAQYHTLTRLYICILW